MRYFNSIRSVGVSLAVATAAAGLMLACAGPADEVSTGNSFDRKAMLQHYADNLIRPAFADLQMKVSALDGTITAFATSPTASNLTAMQTAWVSAYESFQNTNAYNLGPAGEEGLRKGLVEELGTFPVTVAKTEALIASGGTYTLNDFNRDTRGLIGIEYLIFDPSANNALVLGQLQQSNRRAYLSAISARAKKQVDEVATAWPAYVLTFVSRNGTEAGSATSEFYNEFVRSFESLKNFKVGLPLGKRPGQTATEPTRAEGYYSGQSIRFIRAHFANCERIWYGRAVNGADGPGFRAYLEKVEGGPALVAATEAQLASVRKALDALPVATPLARQIQTSPAPLETLHTELQKQTRYFKSDMSSVLGIAITFSSGDGD